MKKIFLVLFTLISLKSIGQVYQIMPQYGYDVKRMNFDSTLQIPTVCGVPTIKSVQSLKKSAIAFDSCNNRFYQYNPKTAAWSYLGSGGGSQNLQSVTDNGNTTSNSIIVGDGTDSVTIAKDGITLFSGTYGGYNSLISALNNSWSYSSNSTSIVPILNGQHNFYLYNSNTSTLTTDTLATLANVRTLSSKNGRFGNDTATIVMVKVHNNSGVQLTNGKVVAFSASGTQSNEPAVRLANNKADSTSANTLGFVSGTIAVNDTGWVILSGKIEKLNTSAFSNGDVIYLDSINGEWTKSKPVAPYHMVYLGVVTKANAGNGTIYVKAQNGYELDEIHDVQINGKVNNNIIVYSDTAKVWKNRSIYSVVDTSNIIGTKTNIAAKVNISDTSTMLSKYLRKTDTATLSSRINLKVNISDTASMLTNYAKTSVVNTKLNISDSSVFDRKQSAAYTFRANNTNAAANMTDQGYRDTSGVYSSTITWTGTTAPSGTTNHSYRMTRVGKMVNINIHLNYGTAGSTLTAVQMALPSEFPTPANPAGLSAALDMVYPATGYLNTANTIPASTPRAGLRVNTAGTGYELYIIGSSSNYKTAWISVTYWTN